MKSANGGTSWVKVSLKYIPIEMVLDPSESINNMGNLRVDVLDASDLPSADRNGKSDPYCKFELNGDEVYKTKVQKKTLQPAWNEFFEVAVPSRTAAKFRVDVYDWDFADKPDFLGAAEINLESLDPFKKTESRFILDGKSGSIRIGLLFRPDYVTRARQGTSTFSGTFATPGRIVTGVAGAPIKGGVAVAGVVGHGVGKGASFLRRGIFGKKSDNGDIIEEDGDDSPAVNGASRQSTNVPQIVESVEDRPQTSNGHARTKSFGASSTHSGMPGSANNGTASFTVVGASDFPSGTDLYISITQISPREKAIGKTKHHKSSTGQWTFDETFTISCAPDAQFKVEAKGDHTFSSDDDLGEHIYFVDDSGSGQAKSLTVGSGTVTLKSSFQAAEPSYADSPKSTLRRSFLSKREPRASRESTPNP
jgi:hypothetical protein